MWKAAKSSGQLPKSTAWGSSKRGKLVEQAVNKLDWLMSQIDFTSVLFWFHFLEAHPKAPIHFDAAMGRNISTAPQAPPEHRLIPELLKLRHGGRVGIAQRLQAYDPTDSREQKPWLSSDSEAKGAPWAQNPQTFWSRTPFGQRQRFELKDLSWHLLGSEQTRT